MDREKEAKKELDTALDIFNTVVPPEDRVGSIDELDDKDFDHWIMFWSRWLGTPIYVIEQHGEELILKGGRSSYDPKLISF